MDPLAFRWCLVVAASVLAVGGRDYASVQIPGDGRLVIVDVENDARDWDSAGAKLRTMDDGCSIGLSVALAVHSESR
jgi:hypothetical protein